MGKLRGKQRVAQCTLWSLVQHGTLRNHGIIVTKLEGHNSLQLDSGFSEVLESPVGPFEGISRSFLPVQFIDQHIKK